MNQTTNVTSRAAMALAIGFSALALPTVVEAQPRWGRPMEPRSGACFYRDPGFRGDYFCTRAGDEVAFLGRGMNNQISSIRTFGDTEVRLYQENRFAGRAARVEGDVSDLRREGWNDRVSSIRVRWDRDGRNDRNDRGGDSFWNNGISITLGTRGGDRRGGYGRNDDGRGNGGYGRGNDPRANDGRGNDGRGNNNDGRGNGGRWNRVDADREITAAYREILEREPDNAGFTLYRNRMENEGWSAAQVREALRTSPEFRTKNQMTEQKAQQIVAAAYRSVLNREPDPASRGWVDRVLREKLTQAQVEAELRKSDEYRNRRR